MNFCGALISTGCLYVPSNECHCKSKNNYGIQLIARPTAFAYCGTFDKILMLETKMDLPPKTLLAPS